MYRIGWDIVVYQTATLTEVLWTLTSLVGGTFALILTLSALEEVRRIKFKKRNGLLLLLAKGRYGREARRFVKQLCFITIGFIAMLTPPNFVDGWGFTIRMLLIIPAFLMTVSTLLDFRENLRIDKYLKEEGLETS